jgi:hypothetical protein
VIGKSENKIHFVVYDEDKQQHLEKTMRTLSR